MPEHISSTGKVKWGSWGMVDDFLKRELDSLNSAVTHIHLAFSAIFIVSFMLGIYSFLRPFVKISQMDRKEPSGYEGAFVVVLGLTIGAVLLITLYAGNTIRRRLVRSLREELLCKAEAIWSISESFDLDLPETTTNLLKRIKHL